MTPAARVQSAIEILDRVLAGTPAEQALTGWARASRFAGSKDRAAVRDHVFGALRRLRSAAARGGAMTGRGVMLGLLREDGVADVDALFTGVRHAPVPLSEDERAGGQAPETPAERGDIPDWLWPLFAESLGDEADAAASALRHRAPVHLRVNFRRADREAAVRLLEKDGIRSAPHPAAATALEVTEGARRIRNSEAYRDGIVELQDAASQALVEALPLSDGMKVLDYCAGGGGKTLALKARADVDLVAHDVDRRRMADLPERAARAGVQVRLADPGSAADAGPFDLVLCDVPCSGSGSWRRAPDGKWRLTPERLDELRQVQSEILDEASGLVRAGGVLAYATCSVLSVENEDQIKAFLDRHSGWSAERSIRWSVCNGTDGFFLTVLTQS